MAKCKCCGNEYDHVIEVKVGDRTEVFDCFECAIHVLAPTCAHCGCKIIGHGVQAGDTIYCCANCATQSGAEGLKDRKA